MNYRNFLKGMSLCVAGGALLKPSVAIASIALAIAGFITIYNSIVNRN